ncbi:MAG: bifunctional (p)ppGpp synthetase/guanosine-3',5'-bis(diphosphate) 3'-pyrophosphohydrolase [Methylotenera sp.]|nr:bifunctional (p)ppGpp synthetase/guanosine-3',5'-bis(diphosphate) 3'-pyrophosphohydrolase [Methylotenera sp.]
MIHGSSSLQIPALSDRETEVWLDSLSRYFSVVEIALIRQACELATLAYASHTESTGVPLLQHATGTAAILISLNLDAETIVAAILYAAPQHIDNWQETIKARFGHNVVSLLEGVLRIEQVQAFSELEALHARDKTRVDLGSHVESLRKMLLAMVQDIRVVLIKLAERTQTLRQLAGASEALQKQVAHGVQGVFSPLANRLGVWQLKWEMEDLSLRYLEPHLYKEVAKLLDSRRLDREQYIKHVEETLKQKLSEAGIRAEVSGRPKHIYSIINKMRRKHLDFEQLFDVRAVRILVDEVKDCYEALSLVQSLWQPISGEFDDYIARPKSNHYRSLHTAVNGPEGLALEVQIRTFEMHEYSELGVAAHWRYKEGGKSDAMLDEKIAWLRQILTWKEAPTDSADLLDQFKTELFQDNVYVFTPQGRVIDLPKDATPIDFAYALHTDLGHRTRGAMVDGHIVPLNYKLQNAQRVEILTNKQSAPSRDWLSPALGYLKSASARAKVRHWFKHLNAEANITQGREKLDKELHRAGAGALSQEKIAQKLHFKKLEDFLNAIGRGDVTEYQLATAIQELISAKPVVKNSQIQIKKVVASGIAEAVTVEGVGNLQTNMAKCCKPAFPDAIVAYVTCDRGVTIHRQACSFVRRLPDERQDRLLNAQWKAGGS